MTPASERRANNRYIIQCPLRYRVAQKGETSRFGTGMTCDMSAEGLSFRCRRPLPYGAHAEVSMNWPAKHGEAAVTLLLTGFVVRSDAGHAAIRVTSHRFRVEEQSFSAIA
jgi:hypothetical protein